MSEKVAQDLNERTVEDLQGIAKKRDIEGRSGMNKDELVKAIQLDVARSDPAAAEAARRRNSAPVDREAYDAVVEENAALRRQLQAALQGAVGARQRRSPEPRQF